MQNYNSRILIITPKSVDWQELSLDDTLSDLLWGADKTNENFVYIDNDLSYTEDELEEIVFQITETIKNCLVIADTTNKALEDYIYYSHNLEGYVVSEYVDGIKQNDSDIIDIYSWCETNNIDITVDLEDKIDFYKDFL